MIKEFIITYGELIVIGFLLLNTGIQKLEKIKGQSDILTWIWQFLSWVKSIAGQMISVIFSTKPGKLPMLFIGLLLMSFTFTGIALAGSNISFLWTGNMAYDHVTHYNMYRSCDEKQTWVKANAKPIPDMGEDVTHKWTDEDLPDGTYYWYGTAVDKYDRESDPSIILSETFGKPSPPRGFVVKIIEWIVSWIKGLFGSTIRFA